MKSRILVVMIAAIFLLSGYASALTYTWDFTSTTDTLLSDYEIFTDDQGGGYTIDVFASGFSFDELLTQTTAGLGITSSEDPDYAVGGYETLLFTLGAGYADLVNWSINFDISGLGNGAITPEDQFSDPNLVELITTNSYSLDSLIGLTDGLFSFTEYWLYEDAATFEYLNHFTVSSITAETAPIPEPATILLLGSGLAGLAWYGRKRKKA